MTISNEQAETLIHLKKKIFQDDKVIDNLVIDQIFPLRLRYELVSNEDDDFSFLWEITQRSKSAFRISLHFQEDESKIGLFRVDYNSGHRNPEIATENLPEKFLPYVGKCFSNEESHVHYHVDGYKSLVWAIPIEDSEVSVKQIPNTDINDNFASAIQNFAQIINLETILTINPLLL